MKVLVCGAGGFIGSHLVKRLRAEGIWVRGVDLKRPEFSPSAADEFMVADLREPAAVAAAVHGVDEVYQLAADMGGAGYIFTGENDASVMHNSATINLNVLELGTGAGVQSSSTRLQPVFIPSAINSIPKTPTARRIRRTRLRPTASTAGRSCLVSGCTCRICAIEVFRFESPAFITSSAPKAHGPAARRKRRPRCVARSPKRRSADRSISGETADKHVRSCSSMSASRACAA